MEPQSVIEAAGQGLHGCLSPSSADGAPARSSAAFQPDASRSDTTRHCDAHACISVGARPPLYSAEQHAADPFHVGLDQVEDILPCTPFQESLFNNSPQSYGSLTVERRVQIPVNIDFLQLRTAMNVLVAHSPILRTRIAAVHDRGYVQVVMRDSRDLQHLPESVLAFKKANGADCMNLLTPTFRYELMEGPSLGEHLMVWTIHRALHDQRMLALLLLQLEDYCLGKNLSPRPSPWRDFVDQVEKAKLSATTYWSTKFHAIPAGPFPVSSAIYRPTDGCEVATHQIKNIEWPQIGASTVLKLAQAIVQTRLTGCQEALFGLVVDGGGEFGPRDLRHVAGPLTAVIPVLVSVEGNMTVEDALRGYKSSEPANPLLSHVGLRRISETSQEAAQACHFQILIAIHPLRDLQGCCFVQPAQDGCRHDNETLQFLRGSTGCTIIAEYFLQHGGLDIRTSFDPTAMNAGTISRMGHQIEHVLRQITNPSNFQTQLNDIDATARSDLETIWTWNARLPRRIHGQVHDLITEQACLHPEAPAVCASDGDLTYGELEELSSRLAAHLIGYTVGDQIRVITLWFEKSVWTTVAQVAAMKAGFASLTLDINLPAHRLLSLATEAQACVSLASASQYGLARRLAKGSEVLIVHRDSCMSLPSPGGLTFAVDPNDAIYIAFTSGSTGRPKGAMVTHSGVCSAIEHQRKISGIGRGTRIFDFCSYAFDVSWYGTLQALTSGACLCVPSESERENDLSGAINRMKPNFSVLTPTVARLIDDDSFSILTTVQLGGEVVLAEDIDRFRRLGVSIQICYGPAECTNMTSIRPDGENGSSVMPREIGIPAGVCYWVLEESGSRLAPLGAIGELWIEGPLVGSGYLNAPTLTAAAFIDNPLWLSLGDATGANGRSGRLYRTGDLVRYDPSGRLMFVRRRDSQVKINGQRVDLGEIEESVKQFLPVNLVAIFYDPKIVIFIINPKKTKDRTSLARRMQRQEDDGIMARTNKQLADTLPRYMIPSDYVSVDAIPMTSTGKVDRSRLKSLYTSVVSGKEDEMQLKVADAATDSVETSVQRLLRDIWALVLGLDPSQVTSTHRWARLGGDSVAAMKVVGRCKEHRLPITVADVFRLQTIEALASRCADDNRYMPSGTNLQGLQYPDRKKTPHKDASSREQQTDTAPVDLVPFVEPSHVSLSTWKVQDLHTTLPVTPFQRLCLTGTLEHTPIWTSYFGFDIPHTFLMPKVSRICSTLSRRHDVLRVIFLHNGTALSQTILKSTDLQIDFEDTADSDLDNISRTLCERDSHQQIALGELFVKFISVRSTTSSAHRLIMRSSHAQFDAVSFDLLNTSLVRICNGEEESTTTIERTIQHIVGQVNRKESIEYWTRLLRGASMTRLPSNIPKTPGYPAIISAQRLITIPEDLACRLEITLATWFAAASATTWSMVTSSTDVVFGQCLSGRRSLPSEMQHTIFPCVTFVPTRVLIDKTAGNTLLSAARQIQDQSIAGIEHEHVDLELIGTSCDTLWDSTDEKDFGLVTTFQGLAPEGHSKFPMKHIWTRPEVHRTNALSFTATPQNSTAVHLDVTAKTNVCTQQMIEIMLDKLAKQCLSF